MKKVILNIEGMTCSACSNGLEKYLNKQKGIKNAVVNLVMATAVVEYDEEITIKDINRYVEEAGFKSLGEKQEEKNNHNFRKAIIFSALGIILMYISMGHMLNLPIPELLDGMMHPKIYATTLLLLTTVFLIWGFDIIKNGIKNIFHKMPNMDSLVGIGVLVNFIYSAYNTILIFKGQTNLVHNLYFESSAIIILFVKLGRMIDQKNKSKVVDTIKNLVTITPRNGVILRDGKEITVTINDIQKGDIVICRPGEKIAVDGIITKGRTHTDEAFITGESKPVSKDVGSRVIAGSINYDGYIEYKAENIGKDSEISHIVNMVVEATNTKAPIARLADKISGYFVPTIFVIAVISFLLNLAVVRNGTQAINALVSVLVVACPCALGLATPLAMVVAIGNCTKNGILVKSSETLEASSKIDTVVFDKTGTLTQGKLAIQDKEISKENMEILQSLEEHSNHPLAKSICENADNLYSVEEFEEISGLGIKGKIKNQVYFAGNNKFIGDRENPYKNLEEEFSNKGESIVYLFTEKSVLGIVGLQDTIKPEMKEVINKLKQAQKQVIMLTGDNTNTANSIARELGIEKVISNVSPKEKLEKIKELNTNNNCLMIGDGINDSPALKTASIGVSVQNGTDITQDSADIILLNENMDSVYKILTIGDKTIKIIKQNLFWALFYNIAMVPLATGLLPITLNPMIASLAMTLSSFTVVINSLRLKR
jgi:Cu+-exporting ATPase